MKYQFPMSLLAVFERLRKCLARPFLVVRSFCLCKGHGVKASRLPLFLGKTILRTRKRGEIELGKGVVFCADVLHNLVGLVGPTILDTRHGGCITIGDDSGFSSVVMSSKKGIRIGCRVKCGGNVRIFDHDFHSLSAKTRAVYEEDVKNIRSKPIIIGDDVFIGTNAIILKGTVIGDRSIVAAGSVVFGLSIPPDSLVKGNPAVVMER